MNGEAVSQLRRDLNHEGQVDPLLVKFLRELMLIIEDLPISKALGNESLMYFALMGGITSEFDVFCQTVDNFNEFPWPMKELENHYQNYPELKAIVTDFKYPNT